MRFSAKVFLFVLFLCATHHLFSQSYPLRNYSVDDGLNSNIVYDAEQDDNGVIWFATSAGVSKYDGKRWKGLSVDDGLGYNEVLKIRKDEHGRLWLLNFDGSVNVIEHDSIYTAKNNATLKKLGPGFYYRTLYAQRNGHVWLNNRRDISANVDFPNHIQFINKDISILFIDHQDTIALDKAGHLLHGEQFWLKLDMNGSPMVKDWFVQSDSVIYLLLDTHIICKAKRQLPKAYPLPITTKKRLLDLYVDDEHNLWLTYENDGVYYLKRRGDVFNVEGHFLTNEYITSTFRDQENNIWFTTYGKGVFMMPANFTSVYSYGKQDGLSDNEVYSTLVDSKHRIWIGHKYGQVDLITQHRVEHLELHKNGINIGRCIKMIEHPLGFIFIATDFGLFKLDMNAPFHSKEQIQLELKDNFIVSNSSIKDISLSNNGDLIVVCQESIHILNQQRISKREQCYQRIPIDYKRYFSALQDNNGYLWYSDFEGLKCLRQGKIYAYGTAYPVLKFPIIDMCSYKDKLIFSLLGNGVVIMEKDKILKHFTTQSGLLSNQCGHLFKNRNTIYVCSNMGLNMMEFQQDTLCNLTKVTLADGLLSNQVNDIFVNDTTLFCATLKGLSIIETKGMKRKKSPPSYLYFTKITWQGKDIAKYKNPHIGYIDKYIRFDFISPFFSIPDGVIYQYKLNDGAWIETQNTNLEFNALNPGRYLLQIRAKHLNTDWTHPIQYPFTILAPFYSTWWFYVIMFSIILFGIYIYNVLRIKRIKKEQRMTLEYEQKINQLSMQALQAMMNPHFIFNSLSAIQQQINAGDAKRASTYLTRFAKLLRKNLETINDDFIPIGDEMERIKLYLESEKMRLGDKIEYTLNVDKDIDTTNMVIPSMIIQPMVENAIWHGIMTMEENGRISVEVSKQGEHIIMQISDNGVGYHHSQKRNSNEHGKSHFGIKITEDRLTIIAKKLQKPILFSIQDQREIGGRGTKVTIELPVIELD